METRDEPIKVSNVLDTTPRLFSLPAPIVLPALFISAITALTLWVFKAPGELLLAGTVAMNCGYFFLFGQEWWRLFSKFRKPPQWVRGDVRAIPVSKARRKTRGY